MTSDHSNARTPGGNPPRQSAGDLDRRIEAHLAAFDAIPKVHRDACGTLHRAALALPGEIVLALLGLVLNLRARP